MKDNKALIPVSFSIIWMISMMVMFSLKVPHHFRLGIFINILFILIVTMFTMHVQVRKEKKLYPFAVNFKNCLKSASQYFLMITAFLFCYFKYINPRFLEGLKERRMAAERTLDWELIKKNNVQWEDKTWEEYLEQADSSAELISSVSLNLSFYFLAMFIISLFFSVVVPLVYKKLILRM